MRGTCRPRAGPPRLGLGLTDDLLVIGLGKLPEWAPESGAAARLEQKEVELAHRRAGYSMATIFGPLNVGSEYVLAQATNLRNAHQIAFVAESLVARHAAGVAHVLEPQELPALSQAE